MNIAEILCTHAHTRPEAAAIIDTKRGRSRILAFARLERAAAQTAALLHETGLQPGDAALVFYPMSAELYVTLVAIFRLGLIAMFLDPSAGREHIERCCEMHPPKAFIASAKAHLLRLISPALRRVPLKFSIGLPVPDAISLEDADRLPPHEPIEPCPPGTPALLTFTSGSTGQPKAAMRTHGFLLTQHRVLEQTLGLAPGEIDLTTLPIFVLANLGSGVTSLIPDADLRFPGAIDPAPVVAQIQTARPSSTAASPALLERLAGNCAQRGLMLSSFKRIFSGGAPVFPRLLDQLQSIAPQSEIVAVYGSTEAEPIAHIARHEIEPEDVAAMLSGRGLLTGLPVSTITLRILPDQWEQPIGPYTQAEFDAACLGCGQPGEIVVNGEHVLQGYLHGVGDEETKFSVDGKRWHRTGDAGYLDERGRLWLLGRCAARIEDACGSLYPFTVESAVSHDPSVRRAAFVAYRGQRILAVEPRNQTDDVDLAFLAESVAWAHIERIQTFRRIPVDKRHNAKIDYPALYKLLEKSVRGQPE
jgi:acyl-CoA synthetase (AMP-forming)/AMP-acid ligase II